MLTNGGVIMKLALSVDDETLTINNENKVEIKISADANNGLSFDNNGKLIATKAGGGSSSGANTPGNAIGPATTDTTASTPLSILGFNSSVSRHKKYTGTDPFIHENDGPVMTSFENGSLSTQCIAQYMIDQDD